MRNSVSYENVNLLSSCWYCLHLHVTPGQWKLHDGNLWLLLFVSHPVHWQQFVSNVSVCAVSLVRRLCWIGYTFQRECIKKAVNPVLPSVWKKQCGLELWGRMQNWWSVHITTAFAGRIETFVSLHLGYTEFIGRSKDEFHHKFKRDCSSSFKKKISIYIFNVCWGRHLYLSNDIQQKSTIKYLKQSSNFSVYLMLL